MYPPMSLAQHTNSSLASSEQNILQTKLIGPAYLSKSLLFEKPSSPPTSLATSILPSARPHLSKPPNSIPQSRSNLRLSLHPPPYIEHLLPTIPSQSLTPHNGTPSPPPSSQDTPYYGHHNFFGEFFFGGGWSKRGSIKHFPRWQVK